MEKPKYFDAHSHISFDYFKDDRDEVLSRMSDQGVWTVTVGVDKKSSEDAVSFAEKHDGIFAAIGLHPADNKQESFDPEEYTDLVKSKKVVAIGECGLDYFRIKEDDVEEKDRQKIEFEKQVQFAIESDLPLMLHCRPRAGSMDAYEDTLDILEKHHSEHGNIVRGNAHFFVGDNVIADRFLKLGFLLSFTGVITFADEYEEVIKNTSLSMMLVETDAPYASPAPYRGKRNESVYVKEMVKKIADIKGEEYEIVRDILVENSLKIFNISP